MFKFAGLFCAAAVVVWGADQRWNEEGLVKFVETGLNPRGGKADPPMPAYTLKHDDAQAIVDYLKTLQ